MLDIARWKTGARFAYSFVYQNAFDVLLRHAVPLHDEFLMPASVAVLAGQIGQIHNVPGSPYHMLHRHLDAPELRALSAKGWTVCSHGMTHAGMRRSPYQELLGSRLAIEEAVGRDVTVLVLPEGEPEVVQIGAAAGQHGYLAVLTAHDSLNALEDDPLCLGRVALAEEGPPPRRRAFDPYDRLALADEQSGWVVDCTEYATPEPIRPDREITPAYLGRRFEKVREAGGGEVWCATPEEVLDYMLTQRATRIVPGEGSPQGNEYLLRVAGLSPRVRRRVLTLRVSGLREGGVGKRSVYSLTDRSEIPLLRQNDDTVWFDVDVIDGLRLRVPDA